MDKPSNKQVETVKRIMMCITDLKSDEEVLFEFLLELKHGKKNMHYRKFGENTTIVFRDLHNEMVYFNEDNYVMILCYEFYCFYEFEVSRAEIVEISEKDFPFLLLQKTLNSPHELQNIEWDSEPFIIEKPYSLEEVIHLYEHFINFVLTTG